MDYLTATVIERSKQMQEAISKGSLMKASEYWDELNGDNIAKIQSEGILNFKRTVSQNYFNFIIANVQEGQFRALLASWAQNPDSTPLEVELNGDVRLDVRQAIKFSPDRTQQKAYVFFVGLLWSLAVRGDFDGFSSHLSEPELGNPVDIRLPDNRLITQDMANSLRELQRFAPHLKALTGTLPILAEIGAGYGRLGWLVLQSLPTKYWVFDIPPALAISEFYLSQLYPDKKVFRWRNFSSWSEVAEEALAADIAFFTSDQLDLIPDRTIDVFAAISCLHEMKPEQFRRAMSLMCSKTKSAIYTKNWTYYIVPADNFPFGSDMLIADEGWTTQFSRVDDVLLDMTEKLFVRAMETGAKSG